MEQQWIGLAGRPSAAVLTADILVEPPEFERSPLHSQQAPGALRLSVKRILRLCYQLSLPST